MLAGMAISAADVLEGLLAGTLKGHGRTAGDRDAGVAGPVALVGRSGLLDAAAQVLLVEVLVQLLVRQRCVAAELVVRAQPVALGSQVLILLVLADALRGFTGEGAAVDAAAVVASRRGVAGSSGGGGGAGRGGCGGSCYIYRLAY